MKKIVIGMAVLLLSTGVLLYKKYDEYIIDKDIKSIIADVSSSNEKINDNKKIIDDLNEKVDGFQDNEKVKEYNKWERHNQELKDYLK